MSLRLGQICGGGPNGAWKPSEWFPLSVQACWYMGAVFVPTNETNWMTMDAISDIALEIVFQEGPLPFAANLTHPRPVTSAFVLQAVRNALIQELGHGLSSESLRQVSVEEWVDLLKQMASKHRSEPRNIAVSSRWIPKTGPSHPLRFLATFLKGHPQNTAFCHFGYLQRNQVEREDEDA
ncbi:hypothetical protein EV361DRAFT_441027 [Lentinula raphanica]|nr:hypothetical protein EV361DRAFT_441027 [Lentinula raphanica]